MTRSDVINEVYRSLRDAFNSLDNVMRERNTVIMVKGDKKATLTFRIKIEEVQKSEKIDAL